ncbi:MAG: copper homeostasis protein CutC [Prevotella sp.]|nr:copper homeostasis protein CutC [Prevotella sp.]
MNNEKRILEVCSGSLQSVINAVEGGAERIELCSALSLDGLTPSIGLLMEVRKMFPKLKIHVLIRPREGDFVYSDEELSVMIRDIKASLPYADGIVSGALTRENRIDREATCRLIEASGGKPFTFHRAFDCCKEPLQAIQQLISMGVNRVLTSGQQATAESGIPLLRELVAAGKADATNQLIVMPGGGVNAANARRILDETGAVEIHGSCSSLQENGRKETSAETVKAVLNNIK